MTTSPDQTRPEIGPPPPHYPECGAILTSLPALPPVSLDTVHLQRQTDIIPRLDNEQLSRAAHTTSRSATHQARREPRTPPC